VRQFRRFLELEMEQGSGALGVRFSLAQLYKPWYFTSVSSLYVQMSA